MRLACRLTPVKVLRWCDFVQEVPVTETAIPPAVGLIRDFVNTYEPQTGEETLETADALRAWLVGQHLVPRGAPVARADLMVVVQVREGLRNILLGHAGHDLDPDAVAALCDTLAAVPVRVDFRPDGYRLVSTRTDPVGQALGRLLDAVRQSSQDGTWPRLKVCARDTCRWAFYDASRNQVRRWCSMAGCGNHVKMRRAYQARKRRVDRPPAALPRR
jgi:predicted RNA-binding Zn ribbon-like protein